MTERLHLPYTDEDFQAVQKLLGRTPRGLYEVVKYHPQEGHPMVIKVIPYVDKAPFPTLYWLTCPILKKEISHIEKDGWIEKLEKEVFTPDSQKLKHLKEDHDRYRKERLELFLKTGGNLDELPQAMADIIENTGIGGIRDFNHLKCFHLHYAHHLADKNTLGDFLDENFGLSKFY